MSYKAQAGHGPDWAHIFTDTKLMIESLRADD